MRTRSSVSITDAAWNGGRPVKRLYRVAPRAIDVGSRTDRGAVAGNLFRGHERGGTPHSDRTGRRRARVVARPGDAEVGEHRRDLIPGTVGRAVEQDVRGLDVEMQHPGLVDLVDGPRDRRHQLDRDTCRQRAGDAVRQASPGDQVEDEVETAVLFARFVELDDVAMADPPDRLGLAKPAPAILRPDPDARAHDLDGHAAGQLRLPRLIDDPHSPPPELALDHETGDRGGCSGGRQPFGLAILATPTNQRPTVPGRPDRRRTSRHGLPSPRTANRSTKAFASRPSVSGEGHGDMGKPRRRSEGSINLRSCPTSGSCTPRSARSRCPSSRSIRPHPLLGRERGVVRDARGL